MDRPRQKISVNKYDMRASHEKSNRSLLAMYATKDGCTTNPTRMSVVAREKMRIFEFVCRLENLKMTARTKLFPKTATGDKIPLVMHTPIRIP